MEIGTRKFLKNAISNVATGAGVAALSVALPYFFVRYLPVPEFSLWVLVLQLGSYVNFLNFGLQTAVGRYIAHILGRGSQAEAEEVLAAAIQILSLLGLVGFCLIGMLAWFLPYIFISIPVAFAGEAREALLWVGSALALGLPFSAFLGTFVGLQQNEIPAIVTVVSKLGLAIALIIVARSTQDLVAISRTYFAGMVLAYLFQTSLFLVICRTWRIRVFEHVAVLRKELIGYCVSLAGWSLATLLVAGLDTTIVAIFAYSSVAAYGVALGGVNFLVGMLQAVFSPLVQIFAKRHARGESRKLLGMLEIASGVATLFLLVVGAWLIVISQFIFPLWIGPKLASESLPIFEILVIANILRLTGSPYAFYLIATGQQRYVILSPLFEGVSNLIASVVGATYLGGVGVAVGTAVGAVSGATGNYLYNLPRTMPSDFSRKKYFRSNIAEPLIWAAPLVCICLFNHVVHLRISWTIFLMFVATGPAIFRAGKSYRAMRAYLAPAI